MVMYRDFAMRKARTLGLVGSVKNLQDGSVLVVVEGDEQQLKGYIEKLERGSLLSHVEHVEVVWQDVRGEFSKFTILYR